MIGLCHTYWRRSAEVCLLGCPLSKDSQKVNDRTAPHQRQDFVPFVVWAAEFIHTNRSASDGAGPIYLILHNERPPRGPLGSNGRLVSQSLARRCQHSTRQEQPLIWSDETNAWACKKKEGAKPADTQGRELLDVTILHCNS